MIFDGRTQANIILDRLTAEVAAMTRKPKLVSILVGQDPASAMYVNLKKKKGEQIGAEVEVIKLDKSSSIGIIEVIRKINVDAEVDGIMVQLPLPFGPAETDQVLAAIDPRKDVDGMRLDSSFIAPVVLACLHVLKTAPLKVKPLKVAVVGAGGFVGQRLCQTLTREGHQVIKVTEGELNNQVLQDCDVAISATGQPNLIKAEMVKEGVVAIDCGAPMPEFDEGVYQKANFYTPVPGGIGPLTVAYLLSNLVKASLG